MIVCIHQPSYWPWLGLLDKIAKSDLFIVLDNVDVKRTSFQYRNIFYVNGKAKYLTLPVNETSREKFYNLRFKNYNWQRDHLTKIKSYYRAAPFFNLIFPEIENFYEQKYQTPLDVILASMRYSMDFLDIRTKVIPASTLEAKEKKGLLIIELCERVNADTYLSGNGAKDYMLEFESVFKQKNISVQWQKFNHPVYSQLEQYQFVVGLACLDLFMFHGRDNSKKIFWGNIAK